MNAIINFINNLFAEETTETKKPKLTLAERKRAAYAAINRGLLRNHGDYGVKVMAKIEAAAKLRKDVAEAAARRSEALLEKAEYSIMSFERMGRC